MERRSSSLDRPNPVGGNLVEGNLLQRDCSSFVGRYPIPMRHGLTIGELAILFNTQFGIGCDLEVVAMQGWKREMRFGQTGLPWVAPSPNLPTAMSALVYPGQVIWEGTNVSEGRGTTQPFELFGAPFIDPYRLLEKLDPALLAGMRIAAQSSLNPHPTSGPADPAKGSRSMSPSPSAIRPIRFHLGLYQAMFPAIPGSICL